MTTLADKLRALAAKEVAAADAPPMLLMLGAQRPERHTARAQAFNEAAALADAEQAACEADASTAAEATPLESGVSGPEYREMRERAYAAEYALATAREDLRSACMNRETAECLRVSAEQTLEVVRADVAAALGMNANAPYALQLDNIRGLRAESKAVRALLSPLAVSAESGVRALRERRDAAVSEEAKMAEAFRIAVLERDGARKERDEAMATALRMQAELDAARKSSESTIALNRALSSSAALSSELATGRDLLSSLRKDNEALGARLATADARAACYSSSFAAGGAAERERLALVFDKSAELHTEATYTNRDNCSFYDAMWNEQRGFAFAQAAAECRKVPR